MHLEPRSAALVGALLLLFVVAGYILLSRRFPILSHPLVIVLVVMAVGVSVSVFGEVVFRNGWAKVPGTARRAAIGGTFWGILIGVVSWGVRRVLVRRGN